MLFSLKRTMVSFVLVLGMVSVNRTYAQRITLKSSDTAFLKILNEIKRQTGYDIFYKDELIRNAKPVSTGGLVNTDLKTVLEIIFKEQPFAYSISGKTIVLTPRKKQRSENPAFMTDPPTTSFRDSLIHGVIVDSVGHPVQGVVIINSTRPGLKTLSKQDGTFAVAAYEEDVLRFYGVGFLPDSVVSRAGEKFVKVLLKERPASLEGVSVESYKPEKKDPTTSVDMTMRHYMSLSQVLQGTVPGLSLQIVNNSTKTVQAIDVFQQYTVVGNTTTLAQNYVRMTVDEFLASVGQVQGQAIINGLLDGTLSYPAGSLQKYKLVTTTTMTNSLVPQIRGANSFSGSTSNMLVVIDGLPQDGFPADYPMTNVESIEVVKDPKELVKWGSAATGGLIMIKTKTGRKGTIRMNYTSNLYYTPAPDFSFKKLQLSSTPVYLQYVKDYDSVHQTKYDLNSYNLTPAQRLLAQKMNGVITDAAFSASWDSLGSLSNEGQLNSLEQSAFSQSHSLNLVGGGTHYNFSAMGTYNHSNGNGLKNNSNTGTFNLNSHFNLLHDKLRVDWMVKYSSSKSSAGYSLDPNSTIEPYQLIQDKNGNYVYDYSGFSTDANAIIEANGYRNYGVNILEDARVNSNVTRLKTTQSRLTLNWDLVKGLNWVASVYYNGRNNANENMYGKQSSYVRQLVDQYGEMTPGGINFYVPWGNIMHKSNSSTGDWNVRTGLSYSRQFGKHQISLSVGGGGSSSITRQPVSPTLYGYNTDTKTGVPIYLPTPVTTGSISNFYSLLQGANGSGTPYALAALTNGDTTRSRSLNWNASLRYGFGEWFGVSGQFTSVLSPLYGQNGVYSTLNNYTVEANSQLYKAKKPGRFLQKLGLATGVADMKMPDLPVQYTNARYQQVLWGNYAIWVSGVSPTQQQGQNSINYYEKMTAGLFGGKINLDVAYNTTRVTGATSVSTTDAASDSSYSLHYVSAAVRGNLRDGAINVSLQYGKSPEGKSQVNGSWEYNIAREKYFHSAKISTLKLNGVIQNISPYQGLGLMMGTNVASSGSFSTATNSTYSTLPPNNTNWEVHFVIGTEADRYLFDLRYYNHQTSGLNNYVGAYTDPATGVASQTSYSSITNKGIEFFLKTMLIKKRDFSYSVTLNGAYNVNMATSVPTPAFTASDSYLTAARNGYNTSNLWTYKWAGLNNQGDPQIYDAKGAITSTLDSNTLSKALVYAGATKAPWTGGLIHEINYKRFFARTSMVFSWGYVMKRYMPTMLSNTERSTRVQYRWQKAGDEKTTDVARLINDGSNTFRSLVVQNTSNNIMSADNIRLQEIMVGWSAPQQVVKMLGLTSFIITLQAQNAAIWTKNPLHVDPATVGTDGKVGMPVSRQYSCTINVGF